MIYKLVGKKNVIIHAVCKENCESNHKQQLTAGRKKYFMSNIFSTTTKMTYRLKEETYY